MLSLSGLISGFTLALAVFPLAHSAPHSTAVQSRASVPGCGVNDDFDVSCWQKLDLTNWLKEWKYNVCDPDNENENKANCCNAAWEWSTCFLKLGIKTGYNCTTISQDTCAFSPQMRDIDLPQSILPQVRYVLLNIFCMLSSPYPSGTSLTDRLDT